MNVPPRDPIQYPSRVYLLAPFVLLLTSCSFLTTWTVIAIGAGATTGCNNFFIVRNTITKEYVVANAVKRYDPKDQGGLDTFLFRSPQFGPLQGAKVTGGLDGFGHYLIHNESDGANITIDVIYHPADLNGAVAKLRDEGCYAKF